MRLIIFSLLTLSSAVVALAVTCGPIPTSVTGLPGTFFAPTLDATATAEPPSTVAPATPRRVVAYYPIWANKEGYRPEDIDFAVVTDVAHFAVVPEPAGDITIPDWGPFPDSGLISYVHSHGARIVLVVGGDDPNATAAFSKLANAAETRSRFVSSLVGLVNQLGYDGVDLDWEFPQGKADRDNLAELVIELREAIGYEKTLSLGIPGSGQLSDWYDLPRMVPYVDWFGAMTYLLSNTASMTVAGLNSPLFSPHRVNTSPVADLRPSLSQARRYYIRQGIPPQKLLVGVPFFGERFPDAAHPYDSIEASPATETYASVQELIQAGWRPRWDRLAQVPFLVAPKGPGLVTYDNPRSIALKCDYVREKGLGGVIVWRLGQDVVGDQQPLLNALAGCR